MPVSDRTLKHQAIYHKIWDDVRDKGIQISKGLLETIIKEGASLLHTEKEDLLKSALLYAYLLWVDDTGARHCGKNGFCTSIGNEFFAYFKSTYSKSCINFYEILRGDRTGYLINDATLKYLDKYSLSKKFRELIESNNGAHLKDKETLESFFHEHRIKGKNTIRILTESMLYTVLLDIGIPKDLIILSDGAPQYAVFVHALCWIHAERGLKKLLPEDQEERELLNRPLSNPSVL